MTTTRINHTLKEPRFELRAHLSHTLKEALNARREILAGTLGGSPSDSLLTEIVLREHFGLPAPVKRCKACGHAH